MGSPSCRDSYAASLLSDLGYEMGMALCEPLVGINNPEVWDPSNRDIVQGVLREFSSKPLAPVRLTGVACPDSELGFKIAVSTPEPYEYHCQAQWVLQHGRVWHEHAPEADWPTGEPRQCFYNSLFIGVYRLGLTYVEGYHGSGTMVFPHAWNIDAQGRVVDLTPRRGAGTYFGVALSTPFVIETVNARGMTGVLDNYQERFPLLRNDDLLDEALHSEFKGSSATKAD